MKNMTLWMVKKESKVIAIYQNLSNAQARCYQCNTYNRGIGKVASFYVEMISTMDEESVS